MKPQLFVIAMSCLGCATEQPPTLRDSARQFFDATAYPMLTAKCVVCLRRLVRKEAVRRHVKLRPAHMFDCSSQELSAILEWLRLEREAA